MTDRIDARDLLTSLTGQLIHTLTGQPNRILSVDATEVIVATSKSPHGRPVPIAWVQDALDQLVRDGEIAISVAFVGAVLATLHGATTSLRPAIVRLPTRQE